MCCIVDVHHTRGLVILFVQKYKENKEIPKDFWKKMSDGTVMADGSFFSEGCMRLGGNRRKYV